MNLSAEMINVRCQLVTSGVPALGSFNCWVCQSSELAECVVDNQTRTENKLGVCGGTVEKVLFRDVMLSGPVIHQ